MRQYLAVRVAAVGHHRRADLTQSNAVTPARTDQREGLRIFCRAGFGLDSGRLKFLYLAFTLTALGLCLAPRLSFPSRLPRLPGSA